MKKRGIPPIKTLPPPKLCMNTRQEWNWAMKESVIICANAYCAMALFVPVALAVLGKLALVPAAIQPARLANLFP